MTIQSKPASKAYRENFDQVFGSEFARTLRKKVDREIGIGLTHNAGSLEGRTDVCAELRAILDPRDLRRLFAEIRRRRGQDDATKK